MDYKLKEVYAVLEIKNYSFSFMVGVYSESQIKVLYKRHLEYRFCDNGVIIDEKNVAKELANLIKDANRQLGLEIERVAITVPANNMTIKTSTKMLNLTHDRLVTKNDIDSLITLAKEVPLLDDETAFFIRPYRYILNEQKALSAPPIGQAAHKVSIKAIVYVTKKQIIQSIFATLKYAKIEIMGILPEGFSLAWNLASPVDLQNGITIIDWDHDSIKAYVFVRETLSNQIIIPGGVKKIINRLRHILNCDNKQGLKYLYKIINLNNNSKDNLIIYSKYDHQQQKQLNLTHYDLKRIVNHVLSEEMETLNEKLAHSLGRYHYPIVVIGEILRISGFKETLLALNKDRNISVYTAPTLGAKEPWTTGLLGNIYYQHLANKVSATNVQSVDHRYIRYLNNNLDKKQRMLPPNENGQPGGSGGTPQGVVNLNQQHFNSSQQYHQKYYQNIK
ncbi:cell division protein FtsA [Spiroplasma poulsonii]|uniref:Cell division protein FtsA n=1 Tax=Spiroplasma poulsonii TaxID=2138 RepID=A0A3S0SEP8_9MOLU|nr:cell division protein FtsA [Spiroplasma poulsonii]MBW3058438.1 cell division protein FtsA [Spiroplasma poulsonii]RUP77463.1 cell division protein FtsA [Spiroplasma poulsonii]